MNLNNDGKRHAINNLQLNHRMNQRAKPIKLLINAQIQNILIIIKINQKTYQLSNNNYVDHCIRVNVCIYSNEPGVCSRKISCIKTYVYLCEDVDKIIFQCKKKVNIQKRKKV